MARALRYSYCFPTGFVSLYPLMAPNTLNYIGLSGVSAGTVPTQAEINAYINATVTTLPYSCTFTASNQFLNILVPCQLGQPQTFLNSSTPVAFNLQPSNDFDSLQNTGSNAGEPYFLNLNGIQYAFNFYVSAQPQTGTITITIPAIAN